MIFAAVTSVIWYAVRYLSAVINPLWLERRRIAAVRWRYAPPATMQIETSGRILVDLTMLARKDSGTGIQRVVRSTIREMHAHPKGRTIQPVRYDRGAFRYIAWPIEHASLATMMHAGPGDIFLGLDLSLDAIRKSLTRLLRLKRQGVRFWFVIYDLLPLQSPQDFSSKVAVRFRWWLSAVAMLADGIICISPHVADEFRTIFAERLGLTDGLSIEVVPMGFNMLPNAHSVGSTAATAASGTFKFILAVGTLEPRKGYGDLLDAIEVLWEKKVDVALVIVGAPGWKTRTLQARIKNHPENGRCLRWLPALDDAALGGLYDRAALLVAPSYGEGFGLPVIEAIATGCPVLARDITAFRAHKSLGVRFFDANADRYQLAAAITEMLSNNRGSPDLGPATQLTTWLDTSNTLLDILERSNLPASE